jgi:hypothetical protein
MAENKNLTTKSDNAIAGVAKLSDFNDFVSGANGFSLVETVVFGDQNIGKQPMYIGILEGPSDPVEVGEEIINPKTGEVRHNVMPTWVFKPIGKGPDGKLGIVENVTHIVPCNYMVDAACKRIWSKCERDEVRAIVGVQFMGTESIKGGSRRLNRYRVSEKYIGKTESVA